MNSEITMKIYYSFMKAGIFVVLNYLLNLLLDREVKLKLWRYVFVFLVMFCTFFYFDRSAAFETVDQHSRGEFQSIHYPDADVDDINFSNPNLHSLVPRENLTRREYPNIDLCPKCQAVSRDCSTCGKCYHCHRCYMCHTQKLSCHECHHQLSNKKCHLCRCKPCVDAKHAKKKQEEEERRQLNNAAYTTPSESGNGSYESGQSRSSGRLLTPDEMDLNTYKPEQNFIIDKKTPLETEEEIERYLHSLGITVTYEYMSYWEGVNEVITSDFQIWGPSENSRKIYLSQKTQDEIKEEMLYFRELGELYFNTAIEKFKVLPIISEDQAITICIGAWSAAFMAGSDPRTKIICSFGAALTLYLQYKVKECREFSEMMQKAFDCNRDADNLEELLNRCALPL